MSERKWIAVAEGEFTDDERAAMQGVVDWLREQAEAEVDAWLARMGIDVDEGDIV